ncbi:hypothetical protein AFL01nite_20610 [Aeromicrobium flavum]|uniref:alpha-amylase n=1 Tax=Aeromicrobium flavum TaxID=416568 RepID=A0A512HWB6_9ACTN|nr:carboxypeptidase-like regulatory domain-containing protein [Aeromicrobium flavum]GEO89734.1 hypothetical protein AFL01nite_20610 [Aeromicrobium flavum]
MIRTSGRTLVALLAATALLLGLTGLTPAQAADTGSISGVVLAPNGKPLTSADASITLRRGTTVAGGTVWGLVETVPSFDSEGRYMFRNLEAGTYRVEVRVNGDSAGAGVEWKSPAVTLTPGRVVTGVDTALDWEIRVAGAVKMPDGRPLSEHSGLWLSVSIERLGRGGVWIAEASTSLHDSARGAYSFEGVRTGTYRVVVAPVRGYAKTVSREFTLSLGEVKTGFDVNLVVGASLQGSIVAPEKLDSTEGGLGPDEWLDRNHLFVCLVDEVGQGCENKAFLYGEETSFSLTGLTAGTYYLAVGTSNRNFAAMSYSSEITLSHGQVVAGVDVPLARGAEASGTITGVEWVPTVVAQRLSPTWSETGGGLEWAVGDVRRATVSGSTFKVSGLSAGTYVLVGQSGNRAKTYSAPFVVKAGETNAGQRLDFVPSGSVDVSIVGPGGSPLNDEDFARTPEMSAVLERKVTVDGESRWLNHNEWPFNYMVDGTRELLAWKEPHLYGSGPRTANFRLDDLGPGTYRLSAYAGELLGAVHFTLGTATKADLQIEWGKDGELSVPNALVNEVPPKIAGQPVIGETLRATNGSWNVPEASVDLGWLRDGRVVGHGSSYKLTAADMGSRISVEAVATESEYLWAKARSPQVGPVRSAEVKVKPAAKKAATLKVKAKAGRKKATVAVTIRAAGVRASKIDGKVTIYLKGKKLRTVKVKNGKAKLGITRQKKGKRTYKVRYSGNSLVKPGAKSLKIRIR